MKKIIIAASVALVGLTFASCNKDYTCKCSVNGVVTDTYDVRASTKNKAEDECNSKRSVAGVTRECKID